MTTKVDPAALRALLDEEGPWHLVREQRRPGGYVSAVAVALPDLLDEVDALRAEVERLRPPVRGDEDEVMAFLTVAEWEAVKAARESTAERRMFRAGTRHGEWTDDEG